MKKLRNTEVELKKSIAYKNSACASALLVSEFGSLSIKNTFLPFPSKQFNKLNKLAIQNNLLWTIYYA